MIYLSNEAIILANSPVNKDPINEAICLSGICLLTVDFLVYSVFFTYVILKAKKRTKLKSFGKVPLLIIAFPNLYFLVGAVARIISYLNFY